MRLSANFSDLEHDWTSCQFETLGSAKGSLSFFKTIPPERIGLNGEYDHSGLAKRVTQVFRQQFSVHQLEQLHITQRGGVVILSGQVVDQDSLDRMAKIASNVMGAMAVETAGVRLT